MSLLGLSVPYTIQKLLPVRSNSLDMVDFLPLYCSTYFCPFFTRQCLSLCICVCLCIWACFCICLLASELLHLLFPLPPSCTQRQLWWWPCGCSLLTSGTPNFSISDQLFLSIFLLWLENRPLPVSSQRTQRLFYPYSHCVCMLKADY